MTKSIQFKSHKNIWLLLCIILSNQLFAQQAQDSKLPFAIANEKKLSDEDLLNKKEGVYLTGIPDLSSDPVNGFGYGGEGSLYFNGKRNDPFFNYTAYRAKLDIALFNTTKSQRELMIKLDIPYIFNTKWRLRLEAGYEQNPNLLYFGVNEKSLNGLTFYPNGDSTLSPVKNADYDNYEKAMNNGSPFYNTYNKEEYILNVSVEHSYMEGKLRTLVGYEAAQVNIKTFSGNSMLKNDIIKEYILGVGRNFVTMAQVGLIYDSRDLEPDPSQGVFAELTHELSASYLGSAFNFNKTFIHSNWYINLLKNKPKKLVLAMRTATGYTGGDAPFYEYQDQWSSEGSIEGLGGAHTLRGYKQSRFLGRVMNFNNFEMRYRFAQTNILNQHLAFGVVPFIDAGAVWNDFNTIKDLSNFRVSEGLGFRIVWNVNTVLRFDYAISKEDHQFFFNLANMF